MVSERVLASGRGWEIVKPLKGIMQLHFYCIRCGHRIVRRSPKGRPTWIHYFIDIGGRQPGPRIRCGCGCSLPAPPPPRERQRAYAALANFMLKKR